MRQKVLMKLVCIDYTVKQCCNSKASTIHHATSSNMYLITTIIILLSNDVQANLGPSTPCKTRNRTVMDGILYSATINSSLKSVKGQNIDELHSFIYANKPDIITLSESWLDCSISSNESWLPLTERWTFHKCLQVFHCINGFCRSYLLNLFSRNSDVHNNSYNTRGCSKIHLEV